MQGTRMTNNKIVMTLLAALTVSQLSFGASFDCEKAGTEVEKVICSYKTLSILDEFLALTYKKALDRSSHKNKLKASQRNWLIYKRNACADDDICLNTKYYSRILELTDTTKNSSLSGSYVRYNKNKPSFHSSDINILELPDHQVYINGVAVWYLNKENEAKGIIHFAEINGVFPIVENKMKYRGKYGCSLMLTFEKNSFLISESTNEGNWGANVTFDGHYRKIK